MSNNTKTEGATKAGSGKYCFPMKSLDVIPAGTGYSTSKGGVVEGERMQLVIYIKLKEQVLDLIVIQMSNSIIFFKEL